MKKTLTLSAALFFCLSGLLAQKTETIKVTSYDYADFLAQNQYKYPSYTQGKIAFKNGSVALTKINYNYFLNTIKFIGANGDTLEIAKADDIAFIATGTDSFFYDNGYYQWAASSAAARLAIRYTYKVSDKASVGAFGFTSPQRKI